MVLGGTPPSLPTPAAPFLMLLIPMKQSPCSQVPKKCGTYTCCILDTRHLEHEGEEGRQGLLHTVHTIKSRGVIRCYFLFSLDALLASSNISLLRNSNTAATCTSAPLPTLEEYRQFAG